MSIPNVQNADKPEADEEVKEEGGGEAGADDGFSPEERRKNELAEDPNFKKFISMYRMKIGLHNIRSKLRGDPVYKESDIDLFADPEEIKLADTMMM
jgi:hypothetical protein